MDQSDEKYTHNVYIGRYSGLEEAEPVIAQPGRTAFVYQLRHPDGDMRIDIRLPDVGIPTVQRDGDDVFLVIPMPILGQDGTDFWYQGVSDTLEYHRQRLEEMP